MKLSIVVPLYNEQESLTELVKGIAAVLDKPAFEPYEVIFVDDGSTDGSFEVIKALHLQYGQRVRAIRFGRNFGKAAALSEGIKAAAGEIIVTMDADLQDDPIAIPEMVAQIELGWDVVSGWKKKRFDNALTKNLPSKFFNWMTNVTSGLKIHDCNCGFKAYRATVAKELDIYGERHRYLPVLAFWNGARVTETVVPHHPRKYGKTKYGIDRFINGAFDLMTLLFLRKYIRQPLHFFGLIGLLFGLMGSAVLAYFGIQWIRTGAMHLRPLTFLSLGAILMGIQFVSIGLIGEMIISASPRRSYAIRETIE